MGILSDKQIRELCIHKGMISPFVNSQVKEQDGQRIISYGLSSYGYDIRCSNKFKIFTNVNSSIVDPKNFDNKSFVQYEGDECIIPPNSFALAHSVELFNIPRELLVVCLGKSTLARCFTGDTKVLLTDGTEPTFLELIARYEKKEELYVYALNKHGEIVIARLTGPRKIGHEDILEVTLSNRKTIRCTLDHKFITRSGLAVEAQHLHPGECLSSINIVGYHTVVSVKILNEKEDVYCLTVPEHGNFALSAGVFVNNCGIIVNVTPLEPGWSGYLTLEFSNTTPLPAKIYANEGCAQLLFLKGDEVCEVAYDDRNGKYMNQIAEPVSAKARSGASSGNLLAHSRE